ncbi:MAG: CotH kinase family protein, partial [Planctomycetota bacterium]
TPETANTVGMAGEVYFSRPGGTFSTNFWLGLSTKSPTATIRYTTDDSEPTGSSALYSSPISVTATDWIRARAYDSPLDPSPITSRTYIKLDPDVTGFNSRLPIIIINSFGLNIDHENRDFHPVSAVFIDTDEITGTCSITDSAEWAGYGGMHIRGNSTEDYAKKQYRFETWDENSPDPDPSAQYMDMDVSLLGFPAESDWIIHGPFSDKTLMRNYQIFTWSRQIGRYAVKCRFVELFYDYDDNGPEGSKDMLEWDTGADGSTTDYWGVYVFMEKIKRGTDRVDIERLESSHTSEPEITGGYIFKKDWSMEYPEEYPPGFWTFIYQDYLTFEDPRDVELNPTQMSWIESHFNIFETGLAGPNYDNPAHAHYYGNYIDIDSFVDHHIIVEFGKNVDGFLLSTFLHKDRGGKINMGPVWDYNGSLGGADYISNWDPVGWLYEVDDEVSCPEDPCDPLYNPCCFIDSCWRYRLSEGGCEGDVLPNHYRWYKRLFEDPEFLLAYADNWFSLREHDFKTTNMLADIDNNVALLTTNLTCVGSNNAAGRNYTKWDVLGEDLWPNYLDNVFDTEGHPDCTHGYPLTYAGHVAWLRDWISDRLDWMDLEIDGTYGDAPPVIKVNSVNKNRGEHITSGDSISMTGGGTILYTTDGSDPRLHGGSDAPSALTYSSSFTRSESTQIKTRIKYSPSNWSAINEATFAVGPVAENLRITEIMYNVDDPNHEFIELKNISGSATIQLNLVKFTDGIDFTFPSVSLAPNNYVVVVRNQAKFVIRYPGVPVGKIAGEFVGAINNGGERIELVDALGQVIHNFRFKDGWYPITDGEDFSLNIIDPTNTDPNSWEYAEYWQPSSVAGGTPAADDTGHVASPGAIVINEIMTHTDSA